MILDPPVIRPLIAFVFVAALWNPTSESVSPVVLTLCDTVAFLFGFTGIYNIGYSYLRQITRVVPFSFRSLQIPACSVMQMHVWKFGYVADVSCFTCEENQEHV